MVREKNNDGMSPLDLALEAKGATMMECLLVEFLCY